MVGDAETLVSLAATRLKVGSKVRIKSGRLEGMEGYVHRKPNGSTMLALRMTMLGYALMEWSIALLEELKESDLYDHKIRQIICRIQIELLILRT